jgi:multidrug resistance efflux pump
MIEMENEAGQKTAKKKASSKRKNAILTVIAILIMIGVGFAYYSYVEGQKYFTTDNAKVTANMFSVVPASSGKLVRYTIKAGTYVEEDEVVGRIEGSGPIRSPITGVVVKSNALLNQTVSPAAPLAVIADVESIYIGANIEETDILKIKEGQQVTVQLDAYPGQKFAAYVSEVDLTTLNALTGNLTSFSTSGTYTKTTQLIPIKITLSEQVYLAGIIGTNATIKIRIK